MRSDGLVAVAPPRSLFGPCCSSVHRRSEANVWGNIHSWKVRLSNRVWMSMATRMHIYEHYGSGGMVVSNCRVLVGMQSALNCRVLVVSVVASLFFAFWGLVHSHPFDIRTHNLHIVRTAEPELGLQAEFHGGSFSRMEDVSYHNWKCSIIFNWHKSYINIHKCDQETCAHMSRISTVKHPIDNQIVVAWYLMRHSIFLTELVSFFVACGCQGSG